MRRSPLFFATLSAVSLSACDGLLAEHAAGYDPRIECDDGECQCAAGFADCDQDPEDGCEVDLTTDASSCGSCGHDCGGGQCAQGECAEATIYASGSFLQGTFAVTAGHIYVTDDEYALIRIRLDGSEPSQATDVFGNGRDVVARGDSIFYSYCENLGAPCEPNFGVKQWILESPMEGPLTHQDLYSTGVTEPFTLPGVTSKYVYARRRDSGALFRISRGDKSVTQLASFAWPTVHGDRTYWLSAAGLFLATDDAEAPVQLLSGGELPPPGHGLLALAGDEESVYYLSNEDTTVDVWELRLSDGIRRKVQGLPGPAASAAIVPMIVEDQHLYVALTASHQAGLWRIRREAPDSEPPRLLATIGAPTTLQIAGDWIYWTTSTIGYGSSPTGSVLHRLAKPID